MAPRARERVGFPTTGASVPIVLYPIRCRVSEHVGGYTRHRKIALRFAQQEPTRTADGKDAGEDAGNGAEAA